LPFFAPVAAPVVGAVMPDRTGADAAGSGSTPSSALFLFGDSIQSPGAGETEAGASVVANGCTYSLTNYGKNTCIGFGNGAASPASIRSAGNPASALVASQAYEAGSSRPSSSTTAIRNLANTVALNGTSAAAVQATPWLTSYLTGKPVGNDPVILEDGSSVISRTEALMWKQLSPFSPLLTGHRFQLA
jgi:hypothetical protein